MNRENIQKIIDHLKADDGSHFVMGDYATWLPHTKEYQEAAEYFGHSPTILPAEHHVECGTALCICGWANLLRMQEEADSDSCRSWRSQVSDQYAAADWLDMPWYDAHALFIPSCISTIDALEPQTRKAAGIIVLEELRDSGTLDWYTAIERAQAQA